MIYSYIIIISIIIIIIIIIIRLVSYNSLLSHNGNCPFLRPEFLKKQEVFKILKTS